MNRMDKRISEVMGRGEKFIICLLPLGDPNLKTSIDLVGIFLEAGVDIVELGMPSIDPYLDSKEIAASNVRSFAAEPDLAKYFETMKEIRKQYPGEPFDVMAYTDTVKDYGPARFVEALKAADMDVHLLADAVVQPADFVAEMDDLMKKAGVGRIRFMPHPFRDDLLPDIGANAEGFMILQAFADPQGNRPSVSDKNRELIARIRATQTKAPIALAYGINTGERAKEAVQVGPDGILVGTAMVNGIHAGDFKQLQALIRSLKDATLP